MFILILKEEKSYITVLGGQSFILHFESKSIFQHNGL